MFKFCLLAIIFAITLAVVSAKSSELDDQIGPVKRNKASPDGVDTGAFGASDQTQCVNSNNRTYCPQFPLVDFVCNVTYGTETDDLCNGHGTCTMCTDTSGKFCDYGTAQCLCDKGWVTYPFNSSLQCNYQQRKQKVAFAVSFLFGYWAVGRFYIWNIYFGVFKFMMCFVLGGIITKVIYNSIKPKKDEQPSTTFKIIRPLFSLYWMGMTAWWFIDWIFLVNDRFVDGNGIPVERYFYNVNYAKYGGEFAIEKYCVDNTGFPCNLA